MIHSAKLTLKIKKIRFAKWKMWFLSLKPFPHYKISNVNEIFAHFWGFFVPLVIDSLIKSLHSSDSDARWGGKKGKNHTIHSATITLNFKLLRGWKSQNERCDFLSKTLPPYIWNFHNFDVLSPSNNRNTQGGGCK